MPMPSTAIESARMPNKFDTPQQFAPGLPALLQTRRITTETAADSAEASTPEVLDRPVQDPGHTQTQLSSLLTAARLSPAHSRKFMHDPSPQSRLVVIMPRGASVLGSFIDACSWRTAIQRIHRWSRARESRYVCICNAHSLVTARHDPAFREAVAGADLATPDGMPVAWMLRKLGYPGQQRINGPDLMWNYCAAAELLQEPVFLYGSTPGTLDLLQQNMRAVYPRLPIAGTCSPPFRDLTAAEDEDIVDMINTSGARIVFVSLGCPKQELWMARHRGKVRAVMVGVGAAFDYHAGSLQRAPLWMQQRGLEWLHRLVSEPRRLWRRYLVTNTLFVCYAARQLVADKWKKQAVRATAHR